MLPGSMKSHFGSDEILSVREAAKFLKLQPKTIYQYVQNNKLKFYKPNKKRLYFRKTDLEDFIFYGKK